MITTIDGNLLDATEAIIAHQCNCTARGRASGVARALFEKFPYCDIYAERTEDGRPGTYSLHWDAEDRHQPTICNLLSQRRPGGPTVSDDTATLRLEWIEKAVRACIREYAPDSIAMPYLIGCGQAKGHWPSYLELMDQIANDMDTPITLYRI